MKIQVIYGIILLCLLEGQNGIARENEEHLSVLERTFQFFSKTEHAFPEFEDDNNTKPSPGGLRLYSLLRENAKESTSISSSNIFAEKSFKELEDLVDPLKKPDLAQQTEKSEEEVGSVVQKMIKQIEHDNLGYVHALEDLEEKYSLGSQINNLD